MTKKLKTPLREVDPFPGLFWYSGWGWGHLYLDDNGAKEWMCRTDAYRKCVELGLKFKMVDSLEGYSPPYLGD